MKHKNTHRLVLLASVAAVAGLFVQPAAAQQRSLPTFEVDKAWPKLPAGKKVGDASSFSADAQDNIYLIHRPRTLKGDDLKNAMKPVVVFDAAGNVVREWGGEGTGFEWPQREHGIHVDYKGNIWLGGNNCAEGGISVLKPVADDQLLKFTPDGKFLLQIGKSNQSKGNKDTANMHRPADGQVLQSTNELFVADGYGNNRVIVYDADTGAFKRTWGAFGKAPEGPDNCQVTGPKEFPAGDGPASFNVAHALRVAKNGTVYLADRENRRVQMFDKDGKYQKQIYVRDQPFARDLALSPDERFLYVGHGKGIAVVDTASFAIVGQIEPAGIVGPGHQIATDSKGNIFIAQTGQGMQKLTYKGMSTAAR
jgi:DNA-binding beta-propeller fold protein YncE